MDQIRGDDWTIDVPTLAWSDGTPITAGDLAAATFRATVAGISAISITPDPEVGIRLRLEVPRALTEAVKPRSHAYPCDIEISINNKRSTLLFEVTVVADVTI